MQGVGGHDEIVCPGPQRFRQTISKIARIQLRCRHFGGGQFDHPGREILSVNSASVLIQFRRKRARAEAEVQHRGTGLIHDDPENASQHVPVSGKRIGVLLIGETDRLVVSVRPQIESFCIQHISVSFPVPPRRPDRST